MTSWQLVRLVAGSFILLSLALGIPGSPPREAWVSISFMGRSGSNWLKSTLAHSSTDLGVAGDNCIAPLNSAQRDHLFRQPAAQEIAHASKARVAGLLDPHAKRDAALIQRCHQPARRGSPGQAAANR